MTYTSLSPEEIRTAVYEEAKKQFLKRGIAKTEMKQLAKTVGIGRTTLYRYFPSIDSLAFLVISEFMTNDLETLRILVAPLNGMDSIRLYFDRSIEYFLTHPEILRFCTEFDMMYATGYPDIPEADAYRKQLMEMVEYEESLILKGQADGSIRQDVHPYDAVSGIGHSMIGYAQRTVAHPTPVEEKRAIMHWVVHSLLDTIKA